MVMPRMAYPFAYVPKALFLDNSMRHNAVVITPYHNSLFYTAKIVKALYNHLKIKFLSSSPSPRHTHIMKCTETKEVNKRKTHKGRKESQ